MSSYFGRVPRWLRVSGFCALAVGCFGFLSPSTTLQAQLAEPSIDESAAVTAVEEDWAMVLNEPDGNVDSPQFHTIMSPYESTDGYFAQVLWNYRETPNYSAGGVQLQSYYSEGLLSRRSMEYGQLSNRAESITWTQRLETDGASLSFEVNNGESQTWGSFGRDMRISADAGLANLNGYSPDTSARESCVTYGSNRVESMMITQVRYYGESGLLWVDFTPRMVAELSN